VNGYLLDTNMVGHYWNNHPNVIARIRSLAAGTGIFMSAITLGEIEFGHAITTSTDHSRREEFERFVRNEFHTTLLLQITRHTACHYGHLKSELFRRFPPSGPRENHPERCIDRATGAELCIDENDLWIAAQAIEHNLVLVTNDEMVRIRRVAGSLLDVEDWTQPIQS
jgi:tRNA(fMet)-specific endonuclease VapC